MKCCEIHNLGLNADNEIKMTMNNTNNPIQTTLKYKNYSNLFRNIDKQINIVTIFVSRIILKLLN